MNNLKKTLLAFKIILGLLILVVLLQLGISIIYHFIGYKTHQTIQENGSPQKITADL